MLRTASFGVSSRSAEVGGDLANLRIVAAACPLDGFRQTLVVAQTVEKLGQPPAIRGISRGQTAHRNVSHGRHHDFPPAPAVARRAAGALP